LISVHIVSANPAANCAAFIFTQPTKANVYMKMQGSVTKSMPDRGFFFITGDDGISYFLHVTELEKAQLNQPAIGDRLSFEVEMRERGPRAVNVEVA
jgi:cold shock protein